MYLNNGNGNKLPIDFIGNNGRLSSIIQQKRTNSMWRKYGGYCILGLVTLLTSLFGTTAWFINYIASLSKGPAGAVGTSPLELAGVTAALGGLILVGAFYRGKDDNATPIENEHTNDLRLVGKLILSASAVFIISFFLIEYVRLITSETLSWAEWFYVVVTDVAAGLACLMTSYQPLAASSSPHLSPLHTEAQCTVTAKRRSLS